jgi:predicted helicase
MDAFKGYIDALNKNLATHAASEGSNYGTLQTLIQALDAKATALILPQHIAQGAPDIRVSKGTIVFGYIEAKDIGIDLNAIEKSEQLKRYLALPNLILTDYLEFRWFAEGKLMRKSRLGVLKDNKVKPDAAGIQDTASLLDGFLGYKGESAETPKELAKHMARLAHFIRQEIENELEGTKPSQSLTSQLSAFRDNLIPDLDNKKFADMYAQTITYGLFAAKLQEPEKPGFSRTTASELIPKTNPFLRETFQHIAFGLEGIVLFWVDELVELLNRTAMEIFENFGKSTAKTDLVVHFYETFLAEYDSALRKTRGVYYTPEPVVSYIVRSVDYLLKTRFDKPQGLADKSVLVLDPAVGTATFLYMVIREIFEAQQKAGQAGYWDTYVAENLLKRIFGFELLMAPYTVAHLKLGLLLKETGYTFHSDERLGVYLTNTLEEAVEKSDQLAGFNKYIVEESNLAAKVKKTKPIMVVLGNPPYSGISANNGKWITERINGVFDKDGHEIIKGYKTIDSLPLGEKNPKMLQDDYVKFIRFGQWRIEQTGYGILGFITNHAYLDNLTFRGMRQSLMNTFTDIYILNLHGNSKKKETAPGGSKDENVFDIQQGVAIGIFIKEPGKIGPASVQYADLWGPRENKYKALFETDVKVVNWQVLEPNSPNYMFIPTNSDNRVEYEKYWIVKDIFPVNNAGLFTSRDKLTIHSSRKDVADTIHDFASLPEEEARNKYQLGEDVDDWKVLLAQKDLKNSGLKSELIVPIFYRPFDVRFTYYTGNSRGFHCRPRGEVMRHMLSSNLALMTMRQVALNESYTHFGVTKFISDNRAFYSNKGYEYIFPLYLYPVEEKFQPDKTGGKESGTQPVMKTQVGREPNISPKFIAEIEQKLGLKFIPDGKGDLIKTFGPEDIFNYVYAVFHSPTYRTRYAEFLKIDFPRLPITSDKTLFKTLAEKGAELAALHLMESPLLEAEYQKVGYPAKGSHLVEKVRYEEKTKRVYINKEQYFEGIEPEVWNFYVGGYQVCEKWLKDRKGRTLSPDDINHYQKIVIALRETTRLMAEIDKEIPSWPIS